MQEELNKAEETRGPVEVEAPHNPDEAEGVRQPEDPQGACAGEKGALNRRQLAFAAIAALLCVALIGGSAWSLLSGGAAPGAMPAQGSSADRSGSSTADDPDFADGEDSDGRSSEAQGSSGAKTEQGSQDAEEGFEPGSSNGEKQDSSKPAGGATGGSSTARPSGKPSSSTQGPSHGQGSSSGQGSSGDAGASGSGAGSSSGQPNGPSGGTGGQAPSKPEPRTVTVTISADGTVGGGGTAGPVTLTFDEGATAYDALAGAGWPIASEWGPMGVYVTSINGIAAGPKTGWTYSVNGSLPNYACSAYTLSDGDVIQWTFVEVK